MAKKRPSPSSAIQNAIAGNEEAYISYGSDGASQENAFKQYSKAVDQFTAHVHASRYSRLGFDPGGVGGDGISGRYDMTHEGYEAWRPNEVSRFKNAKQAILHAEICYNRHGLIKNVIDIMGDFASQGIRLVHPNKRIEKFFQNWFRKVQGVERSERFLNNLYKLGNVVIRVQTAKIKAKTKERLYRARAEADMEVVDLNITKNEIPWKYTFLHPATVDVVGGALANFAGDPQYVVSVPTGLTNLIKNPKNNDQLNIVNSLPKEIREAVSTSKKIPLPKDKTRVFHYKKDDWQDWAFPIISSIALDISLYDKLKLADRAALDGAISNIRIFKLGSLEHKIVPTDRAAQQLASMLESNVEAGTLDLIWGPDIEMIESKTSVHQFLGQAKYEPTLIALYAGLGIPPTLTGTFGAAGTTNNFISLKTLTQRLEYGRDILTSFWDEQIRIVQEAMGFRFPARVEFDLMNLGDEVAEKALLLQLADRNLISDELLQHYFGSDPEMERIRTNNEYREREKGSRPDKAGPFYDPQLDDALKKVALQSGIVTPSEVGLELEPRKKGEKNAMDFKKEQIKAKPPGPSPSTKRGTPGQGRPKNSKDSGPRRNKTFKPKTKAVWARAAQEAISEVINPAILMEYGKKNMRSLSQDEIHKLEGLKFGVLFNLEPLCELSQDNIVEALFKETPKEYFSIYDEWLTETAKELGLNELTTEQKKNVQAYLYDIIHSEN